MIEMTPEQAAQMREERRRAICPRRLRRAATLTADKSGPGEYVVMGSRGITHNVNLNTDLLCDCEDHHFADVQCAHVLYARMREGDERILQALGDQMLRDQQHLADYLRSQRKHRQAQRERTG